MVAMAAMAEFWLVLAISSNLIDMCQEDAGPPGGTVVDPFLQQVVPDISKYCVSTKSLKNSLECYHFYDFIVLKILERSSQLTAGWKSYLHISHIYVVKQKMTVSPVYVSSFPEAANHQPITSCCAAAMPDMLQLPSARCCLLKALATSHSPTVTHKKRIV